MINSKDSGNVLCADAQLIANDNLREAPSHIFFSTIVIRIDVLKSGGVGKKKEKELLLQQWKEITSSHPLAVQLGHAREEHAPLYCPFTPQIWAARLLLNVYSSGNWLHPVKVTPPRCCSSPTTLVTFPFCREPVLTQIASASALRLSPTYFSRLFVCMPGCVCVCAYLWFFFWEEGAVLRLCSQQ